MPGLVATPISSSQRRHSRRRVVGQVGDVGVDVERAVGRGAVGQPGGGQAVEQHLAVVGVAGHVPVELLRAVEGGDGGELRQRRRADVQVLLEPLDGRHHGGRRSDPAEPPAGHREVLGEAGHHDGVARQRERALGPLAVGDAVVDLVGDQLDVVGAAPVDHLGQPLAGQHRAGRVRRAGDDQPVERSGAVEQLGRRRPPGLGPDGDGDGLAPRARAACCGSRGSRARRRRPGRPGRSRPGRRA